MYDPTTETPRITSSLAPSSPLAGGAGGGDGPRLSAPITSSPFYRTAPTALVAGVIETPPMVDGTSRCGAARADVRLRDEHRDAVQVIDRTQLGVEAAVLLDSVVLLASLVDGLAMPSKGPDGAAIEVLRGAPSTPAFDVLSSQDDAVASTAEFEEGAAYVKRSNPKFGLRWITWPTNTFCAAVAWRNYPPAEGTAATILSAVANLDRVRALKEAACDAKIGSRHQQALAATRRREELQAAKAAPALPGGAIAGGGGLAGEGDTTALLPSVPGRPVETPVAVPTPTVAAPPAPSMLPALPRPGKEKGEEPRATGMRVPATATATARTVMDWASLWVRMCSDGESVLGPLNEGEARARYGLSAKQLRNVRNAATSGALRRRATTLGVKLPSGYVDSPTDYRVDGRDMAGVAA